MHKSLTIFFQSLQYVLQIFSRYAFFDVVTFHNCLIRPDSMPYQGAPAQESDYQTDNQNWKEDFTSWYLWEFWPMSSHIEFLLPSKRWQMSPLNSLWQLALISRCISLMVALFLLLFTLGSREHWAAFLLSLISEFLTMISCHCIWISSLEKLWLWYQPPCLLSSRSPDVRVLHLAQSIEHFFHLNSRPWKNWSSR